ncbi:MAG: hypothetical protein LBE78_12895 [Burkholderiaceae bacterium]|jgi:hypothetical protein|nr:hypothetical protein [Burkholderiaceae bacterium]
MAYTTFPAYAQLVLDDGYQPSAGGGVARTEMDDGFIEQSRLQSLARYEVDLSYRLQSQADKDAFESWRRDDLGLGAAYFAWPDPEDATGATLRRARLVNGAVRYQALSNRFDEYLATFTLEYWA